MSKKKSILLTFVLLMVGGLTTFAAAAPDGDAGNVAKIGTTEYATLAEAVTAANTGDVIVIIQTGIYTVPNLPNNITIKADNGVNVTFNCEGSNSIASIPNGATFQNVTMNFGQSAYHGFQHAGTINMNNCTLNGLFFSYGDMNFNSCIFNQTAVEYMMWDYAGNISYTNCTFNGKGKFLNIYNEGNTTTPWKVTAENCVFNSSKANKAALNIKETCGSTFLKYDVTITNCTCNDTQSSLENKIDGALYRISPIWQVDDIKEGDAHITVTVNGNAVFPVPVAKIGEIGYASLAKAIAAVQDGETITMIADEVLKKGQTITLENNEQFTLDLNGKTISIAETGFDFTANGTNVALRNGIPVRFAIVVNGNGTMNICDNSTDKLGKIETKNNSYGTTKSILVDGNATVNLNSGTITADYAPFYIVGYTGTAAITDPTSVPKPSLNVNGGKIEGQELGIGIKGNTAMLKVTGGEIIGTNSYGISTNGTQDWYDGGKFAIEITGGTIKSTKGTAMYLPAEGPTVITGGTLEGAEGIAVKGGILSISGDAIVKATGEQSEPASAFSGYTQTGSCIYIEDTYSGHKPIVNISGGMFSSANNYAVQYYTNKDANATDKGKVTVYAGLYDDESAKDYLADGKTIIVNTDETTKTDYPHAVVPLANEVQVAPDLEITSNDEKHPLTPDQQTAAETAVKEAITDMAENTEVTNLPDENNDAVESGVVDTKKGQSVGINVEFTGTKVSVETGTGEEATTKVTLKELTFDVKPYVVEKVTIGEKETSVAVRKIENDQITAPMTFRLPIPSSVEDNYARVKHYQCETETEDMGLKEIKSTTTDESKTCKYIEITTTSFSKFEAILKSVSEPNTLYYYAGNDTKVEGTDATPSAFSTAQKTNKNAIAFVSEEYADWAETQTNVVVDYGEGETNGNRYVCPKFVLTDLEDFYSPVDFKALEGSYTRTNTQGLNSVCLPFAITTENVNNGKIGRYKSSEIKDDKTGTISFDFVESVDAGVPCIVDCEDNKDWTITFDDTEIKSAPVNNEPMKGSYVENVIGVNFFKVSSDGTKFVNTVEGSKVFPFRAYLDLITQTGAKELTIEWNDGSTTGINTIESKHIDNIIYDLTGRKVNNTVKGSVYIMNGKKYIK